MTTDMPPGVEYDPGAFKFTGGPAARDVFVAALLEHLQRFGAKSITEITGKLGYFWLRMNEPEVRRLVEAARRRKLVEPLDQTTDAYERDIHATQWAPTEAGMKVRFVRGLAGNDVRTYFEHLVRTGLGARETVTVVAAVLAFILGSTALLETDTSEGRAFIYALAFPIIWVFTVGRGMRGMHQQHIAAESWPRLSKEFVKWETSRAREWLYVSLWTVLLLVLPVGAILFELRNLTLAFVVAGGLIVLCAVMGLILRLRFRRPVSESDHD